VSKEIKEIIIAFTSDSPKKREKYGFDYVFESDWKNIENFNNPLLKNSLIS